VRAEQLEDLVDVPRHMLEFDREGHVARPRVEHQRQPLVVARDLFGNAKEHAPEPASEQPVGSGQPGDRFGGRRPERAHAAATLRLDDEAERRLRLGQPSRDPIGLRMLVEGVVELDCI